MLPAVIAGDVPVIWEPQAGSQMLFLACPVFELCYEGTRGPGKTDALLMAYAQHVGCGYGAAWRGIIFRRTYKQLEDVVAKSKKWFYRIFPGARFDKSDYKWTFPDGEELLLRYMDKPEDYWNYHGHEYPFIGWEELTNWPTSDCYLSMMSCCRSSHAGVPRMYRSTTNPWGAGHHWVKARFIDSIPLPGTVVTESPASLDLPEDLKAILAVLPKRPRTRLRGTIWENKVLLKADPTYLATLMAIEEPNKRKAWLEGSWDIIAGGAFSDLWNRNIHAITPFQIPSTWRIKRSYDDGDAKPFSVGWWAVSDGSEVVLPDGRIFCPKKDSHIRINEWYGWNGKPNEGCRLLPEEIAEGIKTREKELKEYIAKNHYIYAGPADNAIFDAARGKSVADKMAERGVSWTRSDKKPGSRIAGVKQMRSMLKAATAEKQEAPSIYCFTTCHQFLRLTPTILRDERNMDDVDTDSEDHIWDETRYAIMDPECASGSVTVHGM